MSLSARRKGRILRALYAFGLLAVIVHVFPEASWAQDVAARRYGDFPFVGSRIAIWVTAQVHLLFAAFVLGVPMFAVVAEAIGMFGGDEKYDKLAKEFTRLLLVAYSATAIWGAILSFLLVTLYPPPLALPHRGLRGLDVGLRRPLLFRVVYALPVLLRMGSLEGGAGEAGALGRWGCCSTCGGPWSCSSPTPGSRT